MTVAGGNAIDFVVNDSSKPVRPCPVQPRALFLAYPQRSQHGGAVGCELLQRQLRGSSTYPFVPPLTTRREHICRYRAASGATASAAGWPSRGPTTRGASWGAARGQAACRRRVGRTRVAGRMWAHR